MEGYIKAIRFDRDFGFIAALGEPDIFFHREETSPRLPWDESLSNRRVRFDVEYGRKGPLAVHVRPAD